MRKLKERGFTLIELMIAVAVVGILAAVAYPSYTQHIRKGNRAAAQAQMLDIANRQQQYLLASRRYATKTEIEGTGYTLPSDVSSKFTWAIATNLTISPATTVPAFTITFTPNTAQSPDTGGADLTLNSEGGKAPLDKW